MSIKNKHLIILCLCSFFVLSFAEKKEKTQKETKVIIKTNFGDIKIKLYNETPKHRDNFIKLVKEHFYDSLLFHRVISEFMIQGGDPTSKRALPSITLGNGENGYTIPAEIVPSLFHKKGALAAARMGDDVNPKKESSGCQFYIVQGRLFTDTLMTMQEERMLNGMKQDAFRTFLSKEENKTIREKFIACQQQSQIDSIKAIIAQLQPQLDVEFTKLPSYKFSEAQRTAYKTIGGTPHLDGNYTVFGEVLEGLEVVDKIAKTQVDGMSRPLSDVRIIKAYIVKK